MDTDELMTRRALAQLALRATALPGAAIFFSSRTRAAQGHDHHSESNAPPDLKPLRDYQPKFFTQPDFEALQAFTEILIPADGTPGARDAYCAHFIDFVLQASDEMPETQKAWRNAMQTVKDTGFYTAEPSRRVELITEMSRPETDRHAQHPAFSAYRLIKQMTVFAFYTSRAGMIETLDYKGNSYNAVFAACNHPEHQRVS